MKKNVFKKLIILGVFGLLIINQGILADEDPPVNPTSPCNLPPEYTCGASRGLVRTYSGIWMTGTQFCCKKSYLANGCNLNGSDVDEGCGGEIW